MNTKKTEPRIWPWLIGHPIFPFALIATGLIWNDAGGGPGRISIEGYPWQCHLIAGLGLAHGLYTLLGIWYCKGARVGMIGLGLIAMFFTLFAGLGASMEVTGINF